jgi:integrase
MATRQSRIRIGPGCYREGNSLVAYVRVGASRGGRQLRDKEKFPLGTDAVKMITWQHKATARLLELQPRQAERGTLAADVADYLTKVPAGQYKKDTEQLLAHWTASPVGAMSRGRITDQDVQEQITKWLDDGVANSSCNHRLSRLRKMLRTLDRSAPNPAEEITFLPQTEREARDIPPRIVQLILDSMPDRGRAARGEERPTVGHAKIRLRILAWSGIAPATMRRVTAQHLELTGANPRIYLRPRRKGKAKKDGAWVSLLPQAVDALRDYAAANLFGTKASNSSIGKTWRVGIARATRKAEALAASGGDASWLEDIQKLPPRPRPYDLRHAFACEMYRITGDIHAVGLLLQHSSPVTTARYTKGAVPAVVAAAITKAGSTSYANIPTMPAPVVKPAARRMRLVHAS